MSKPRHGPNNQDATQVSYQSREQLVKSVYEAVAADVKKQRVRGCCQRTILALQDALEMKDDSVFKAGSGLHGGIGTMRDTCGSLLGACMMLSYRFGSGRDENREIKPEERPAVFVGKLYKWFQKEFATNKCLDICTRHAGGVFYDTSIPWQQELAIEAGVYEKCDELIKKTAAKAAELIWDFEHKGKES